jgi:glutathione S-transferase
LSFSDANKTGNIVLSSQLDSIAWGAEDLRILFFKTAFGSDEDKKKNSAEFPAKVADRWFPNFNKLVGSGPFFLGQAHATHADFAVFDIIWTILSHPVFGESSKKALQANPALNAWYDRINALPAVHSWIEKRPATNF